MADVGEDLVEKNQDGDTKMAKPDSAASSSSPAAPPATVTPSAPSSSAAPKWKAEKSPSAGVIGPEWFDQKEYSNLSVLGMIYELLDNSIYHRVKTKKDHPLKIEISIIEDKNNPKRIHELRIEDNASGMEVGIIPLAFSPYGMSQHYAKDPEALSEHGLGMKAALRGLAETHVIHTSHISDSKTYEVKTDDIRYFPTPSPPTLRATTANVFSHGYNHGTIIRMWNLTEKAQELGWFSDNKKKNNFSKMLSWNLGQRYRNFLMQPYFRQSDTGIFLCRYDHTGKNLLDRVKVEREEPRYWGHQISKKKGTPWFKLHTVQSRDGGKTWKARFTLGQSPKDKEEWTSLGEKPPIQTHPYYVSKANRGFDVLRKGIVLEPKFFVDKNHRNIGSFAKSESAVFNFVRGEIWLDYGFQSSEEKTGVHRETHWFELIQTLTAILKGEREGPSVTHLPDHDPSEPNKYNWWKKIIDSSPSDDDDDGEDENTYRIGVSNYFIVNKPIHKTYETKPQPMPQIVKVERDEVDNAVGRMDIYCNRNTKNAMICEVKAPGHRIRGLDVYQLFMYMQEEGARYGMIVGDQSLLTKTAKRAIENIHSMPYLPRNKGKIWRSLRRDRIPFVNTTYKIGIWNAEANGDGIHTNTDDIIPLGSGN